MNDDYKERFISEPITNGFENYNLFELKYMLRGVLKYAVPEDKSFIKELAFEIDRRKRL